MSGLHKHRGFIGNIIMLNLFVLWQMSSEQNELYSESVIDPLENSVSTHRTAETFDP